MQATEEEQQARLASISQAEEDALVKDLEAGDRDEFRQHIKRIIKGSWRQLWPYSRVDSWTNVFKWAAQQDIERAAAGFQDWKGPSLALLRSLSDAELHKLLTDERLLLRFYGGPNCAALVDAKSKHHLSAKKTKTLEWSIAKLVLKLLFYSCDSPQPAENKTEAPVQVPSHVIEHRPLNEPTVQVEVPADITARVNVTVSPKTNTSKEFIDLSDPAQKSEQPRSMMQGQSFEDRLAQIDAHIFSLLVGGPENITDANSPYFRDFESPSLPRFRENNPYGNDEALEVNYSMKRLLDPEQCNISTSISKIGYNLLTCETPPNVHTYNMLLVRFCHLDYYKMFRAVLTSMRESHIRPNELTHSTVLRYFTITDRGTHFMEYVLRMEGHLEGLALAHPSTEVGSITSQRYHTFMNGKGKKKIAEKARMNGEVYEALITGALRFFGPQSAIQYYRDMISEGWKVSLDLLIAILKSCYRRCDWDAGVSVWHQITAISDQANSRAFAWMLCLCQACGQHVAFEQLVQDGVNAGTLPASMLPLSDYVKPRNLGSPCKDAETPESGTIDQLTSESPSMSWVEKHVRNRITIDTKKKNEERPTARVVLADPIDSAPVSWVEKYSRRSMAESKCSYQDPSPVNEEWQKTRLVIYTPAEPHDSNVNVRLGMVHDLAKKVKQSNKTDIQKMNNKEYDDYRYELPNRLMSNKQFSSRNFFEKYKTFGNAKLEREDQEGRIYYEPSPFTALDLGRFVAEPGSLSSDDERRSCLIPHRSSATTMDRSSHPLSENEQDDVSPKAAVPETSSSFDDYTSHVTHDTPLMPIPEQTSHLPSPSALEELPSENLARLNQTSHLTRLAP